MPIGVSIGALNEAVSVISEGFTVTPGRGSGHFIDGVALFVPRSTLLSLPSHKVQQQCTCVSVRVRACERTSTCVCIVCGFSTVRPLLYNLLICFSCSLLGLPDSIFFSTYDASNDLKENQQCLLKFMSKHSIRPSFRMHPPIPVKFPFPLMLSPVIIYVIGYRLISLGLKIWC